MKRVILSLEEKLKYEARANAIQLTRGRNDYRKRKSKKAPLEQKALARKGKSRSFYRSKEWKTLRFETIVKYGRTCMACGRKAPSVIIHIDHIKPRLTHPHLALDANNLQILCATCNEGKGCIHENDFRPEQDFLTDAARKAPKA